MAKRTPEEVWSALQDQAMDEEMEAVLAMSPEERRRELREAGFDLDKVHARADALGAEPAPSAPVAPPRWKRSRLVVALPVVAALAAGVAVVLVVEMQPPPVTAPHRADPQSVRADTLRDQARDACAARDWQTCLDDLNQAKDLDPAGDETPEVQSLRRSARDSSGHP